MPLEQKQSIFVTPGNQTSATQNEQPVITFLFIREKNFVLADLKKIPEVNASITYINHVLHQIT